MAAHIMVGAPVVSGALAVYPIGRDEDPRLQPRVLTLPEALDEGLAVMRETGRVHQVELFVRDDRPVLCLAGDLAVGAKQDRVISRAAVAMRRSGKANVPAYCIERDRWQRRGRESQVIFGSSTRAAPSSLRKLLVQGTTQERVWQHVQDTQRCLSFVSSAGSSVRDPRSRTSLALSLARPELDHELHALVEPLMGLLDEDAVGHAVVIGGRLSHAELFGSAELHNRVFRRLIESAAVDALAAPSCSALPDPEEVGDWLERAFRLPAAAASPAGAGWSTTRRGESAICVETRLRGASRPVHALIVP